MAQALKTSDGDDVVLQEGESSNVVISFYDIDGTAIPKTSLVTLTCSLYDKASRTVINNREDQDILDDNNGTVTSGGVLTLRLGPSDSVITGDCEPGQSKTICLDVFWTWSDGVETRHGITGPLEIRVEKLPSLA